MNVSRGNRMSEPQHFMSVAAPISWSGGDSYMEHLAKDTSTLFADRDVTATVEDRMSTMLLDVVALTKDSTARQFFCLGELVREPGYLEVVSKAG